MSGLDSREPGARELLSTPLDILVLGDSSADPEACPTCSTYVDQSAAAWSQRSRRRVRLDRKTVPSDRGRPLNADPGRKPPIRPRHSRLRVRSRRDPARHRQRRCHTHRRYILPCGTASALPKGPRREVPPKLGLMDHRDRHHPPPPPGDPCVVTPPPTSGLPRQSHVARTACQVAAAHAAACVNVYDQARTDELVVDPGPDPQHPQLTQHGHDIVAAQLSASGITP